MPESAQLGNNELALVSRLHDAVQALKDEIRASLSSPSRAFDVRDGKRVHSGSDGQTYQFRAEVTIPIPADSPVRLLIGGRDPIPGTLIGVHDFDVLLDIREDVGEEVPEARVSSEPWFIYESLAEKLTDLADELPETRVLPCALLGLDDPPTISSEVALASGAAALGLSHKPEQSPNDSQLTSIGRSLSSPLHYVWGPPGTGKTENLAQTVRALVANGEKVMILAHANAAVDVAILRVADAFAGTPDLANGKILRLGYPQLPEVRQRGVLLPEDVIERTQPDLIAKKRQLEAERVALTKAVSRTGDSDQRRELAEKLRELRKEIKKADDALRQARVQIVKHAQVISCTLSRMAIDNEVWTWQPDAVVVDESSMAPFPAVLAASFCTKQRLLVFGDFRQLPPIHLANSQTARLWLGRDPFDVADVRGRVERNETDDRVTLLNVQYRMAPRIANVVSNLSYGGRLETGSDVEERVAAITGAGPWEGESLVLVDTAGLEPACFREPRVGSYSRVNPMHAALGLTIARLFEAQGLEVGLISPYRAQARLIQNGIRSIPGCDAIAATVHKFQGSERQVIIFDFTDAPLEQDASKLTGKDYDTALRLLNVALSRAKGKLIVLAHKQFIETKHRATSPARAVMRSIQESGFVDVLDVSTLLEAGNASEIAWYRDYRDASRAILRAVGHSNSQLVLNLPDGFKPPQDLLDAVATAAANKLPIVFAPYEIAEKFENVEADIRLLVRPGGFFSLCGTTAFVGGLAPHSPVARFEGKYIIEALWKILLGETLQAPAPSAAIEKGLTNLWGRCPECGEQRRPGQKESGQWVLSCAEQSHPAEPLTRDMLEGALEILQIPCPECGAPGVAREANGGLFIGCRNYKSGCHGHLPRLSALFGEVS